MLNPPDFTQTSTQCKGSEVLKGLVMVDDGVGYIRIGCQIVLDDGIENFEPGIQEKSSEEIHCL